jgi:predicted dehydrogenase
VVTEPNALLGAGFWLSSTSSACALISLHKIKLSATAHSWQAIIALCSIFFPLHEYVMPYPCFVKRQPHYIGISSIDFSAEFAYYRITMAGKPRVGLVGVGHLGRVHLTKLQKLEGCQLVGFFDIDRPKSEKIASETEVLSAESLDQLLERADVIDIVVPTSSHYVVGREALQAGKHVFMEKPLARFAWEGQELCELAEARGLALGVGHIERFNPAIRAMQGRIGRPLFIEAHRLSPFHERGLDVAVILELMTHDIDLCFYFTESAVEDIQVSAVQVLSDQMDIANARLIFKSGCVANLTASRISTSALRKIRIFQKNNYLSFDLKEKTVDSFALVEGDSEERTHPEITTSCTYEEKGKRIVHFRPPSADYDMLEMELSEFLQAVSAGRPAPVDGRAGLRTLQVAREIEKRAWQSLENISSRL